MSRRYLGFSVKHFLRSGFSLMEMMIVLLIVAIVAAATTPMVTKKIARNSGSGDSPWIFMGLGNDITYNLSGNNTSAIIGTDSLPTGITKPRLYIQSDTTIPHISFRTTGQDTVVPLIVDTSLHTYALFNGATISKNTVALGEWSSSVASNTAGENSVLIGTAVSATGEGSIAIGSNAVSGTGKGSIAIGSNAVSGTKDGSIAIGSNAVSGTEDGSIAGSNSIAIGSKAKARGSNCVAIGSGVEIPNTVSDQIRIGKVGQTVYIPGDLVVGRMAYIGYGMQSTTDNTTPLCLHRDTFMQGVTYNPTSKTLMLDGGGYSFSMDEDPSGTSDRRLKNVGEEFKGGLEDLKKLPLYHYTFKNDEAKTPRVGVIAQDLQKVFPNAVTKGHDGYLRIRFEDMFYALINAVKELDKKISDVIKTIKNNVEDIVELKSNVDTQSKTIEAQQKIIEDLQKQNADLIKRVEKLEKK